jgi:acetyltransferase
VYAVLMARNGLPEGRAELHDADIPAYIFPESAARGLAAAVKHEARRNRVTEPAPGIDADLTKARSIIRAATAAHRSDLTQVESLQLVKAYGIGIVEAVVVHDRAEATNAAAAFNQPLALKIMAAGISHKSDVGGVQLNVQPEEAGTAFDAILSAVTRVRSDVVIDGVLMQPMASAGVELIVGAVRDPLFGAAIMLGAGGILVELMKDVVFRFAPLTTTDARAMLDRLRSHAILDGFRGHPPVDRASIVDALLRMSRLMLDCPEVVELDINPLFARPSGVQAVDCRVRLRSV